MSQQDRLHSSELNSLCEKRGRFNQFLVHVPVLQGETSTGGRGASAQHSEEVIYTHTHTHTHTHMNITYLKCCGSVLIIELNNQSLHCFTDFWRRWESRLLTLKWRRPWNIIVSWHRNHNNVQCGIMMCSSSSACCMRAFLFSL